MEKAKVYFTDLRTKPNYNLLDKLENLIRTAGIGKINFNNKFTAIKIHFGEPGNLAYIRPNYVKRIVGVLNNLGAKTFLTDASTLYLGRRSNAVDHLETAAVHGFNPLSTDCNVIIADGLKGTDYKEIEINCKHVKTAKIGTAVVDADIIISINHVKGHELTGFGGAIKNIGMGCGSKAGKLEMHSTSKPRILKGQCAICGQCMKNCSQKAIYFGKDKKAEIDYNKCIGCGQCIAVCTYEAASLNWDETSEVANEKIAEYAYAVVKDKPSFHINFIMNVSPNCDCWPANDMAIVPDIGIAASFDPVALDQACVDMINNAKYIDGSALYNRISINHNNCCGEQNHNCGDKVNHKHDKFKQLYPATDWEAGIKHAELIGLGTSDYELIVLQ